MIPFFKFHFFHTNHTFFCIFTVFPSCIIVYIYIIYFSIGLGYDYDDPTIYQAQYALIIIYINYTTQVSTGTTLHFGPVNLNYEKFRLRELHAHLKEYVSHNYDS